ncbi:hypothetical protein SAMD00019534_119960, partial [Acytostelium subglobosum LB1]|uniref:hypothetical protein n=1 Tax=Acytostelium subglobosum LB1 TaxID=1410327 RepID=UPI0006451796
MKVQITALIYAAVMACASIAGTALFLFLSPLLFLIGLKRTKQFAAPKSIVITGASSGIGRELAIAYAAKGVNLYLTGRDQGRLSEVAQLCKKKGATVSESTIDSTNTDAMSKWLLKIDKSTPVDLVIANAGINEFQCYESTYEDRIRQVANVNINGVLNTVLPLLPAFRERRNGQIAFVGSMAFYMPLLMPGYIGSKYYIHGLAISLRQELAEYGIGVTLLIPGCVKTRMVEYIDIDKPFELLPEQSAAIFKRDISANLASSYDNPKTLFMAQILNKAPANVRDGWIYLQRLLYSESFIDSYSYVPPQYKNK